MCTMPMLSLRVNKLLFIGAAGYRSVAHYLVLTQQKSAKSTAAETAAPVSNSNSVEPVAADTSDEPAQTSNAGESFAAADLCMPC